MTGETTDESAGATDSAPVEVKGRPVEPRDLVLWAKFVVAQGFWVMTVTGFPPNMCLRVGDELVLGSERPRGSINASAYRGERLLASVVAHPDVLCQNCVVPTK